MALMPEMGINEQILTRVFKARARGLVTLAKKEDHYLIIVPVFDQEDGQQIETREFRCTGEMLTRVRQGLVAQRNRYISAIAAFDNLISDLGAL